MKYNVDLADWVVKEVEEIYKYDLKQRLFEFGVDVLKFLKTVDSNRLYEVFR